MSDREKQQLDRFYRLRFHHDPTNGLVELAFDQPLTEIILSWEGAVELATELLNAARRAHVIAFSQEVDRVEE